MSDKASVLVAEANDSTRELASLLLCFGKPSEPQLVGVTLDPLVKQLIELPRQT